jgi:hypothetical protein
MKKNRWKSWEVLIVGTDAGAHKKAMMKSMTMLQQTIHELNVDHLTIFRQHMDHPVIWHGKRPRTWAHSLVGDDSVLSRLPDDPQTRDSVMNFCNNDRHADEACFIVIMAWGGMRSSNAKLAWYARERWLPIVRLMREGTLRTRSDTFAALLKAKVPGMRIAYFTKLMYFLCTGEPCYILDQWTARSSNLLSNAAAPLVRLRQNYVTNDNTVSVYLAYCDLIDYLAMALNRSGEQIEQSMFAAGRDHPWRSVVRKFG